MRRSTLGAFVLAVGTIALTQPAVAKCVSGAPRCPKIKNVHAVIRGPGLDQPVVVRGDAFWNLARRTGISGYRTAGVEYAIEDEFPGEQALGPRYVVRYVLRVKGWDPIVVAQDLYPYVVNAGVGSLQVAWAFTPKVSGSGDRLVSFAAFLTKAVTW